MTAPHDGRRVASRLVGPRQNASRRRTILHGNAGNIAHRIAYLPTLHDLGYSTLLVDYRGYGASTGTPSEQGPIATAPQRGNISSRCRDGRLERHRDPGGVVGRRRGDVAGARACAPRAGARIDVHVGARFAATIYLWLPVRWLSRIQYNSLDRIGRIDAPVFIAHSRDDDLVRYTHGRRLFAAAHEPKQLLTMSGGHNDTFLFARPEWAAALEAFLQRTGPTGGR